MIIRRTLSLALITALAGAAAPYDARAEALEGHRLPPKSSTLKAVERVPFYVRHGRGRGPEVAAAVRAQGGEITHDLSEWDTFAVMLPAQAATAMANNPAVTLVESVPEHKLQAQVVPWNIDQFQARDIWDKDRDGNVDPGEPNGSGVKFCIIDTGFFYDIDGTGPDTGHDDFRGIVANGVSQITGEQWHFDGNGHGTHVAGTANAVNNDIGVVGVMPGGAELYIVKIFNNAGVWVNGQSNLGAAAQACRDAGANVLSMSLGGGASVAEEAIFQGLYDTHNILNIAAAGNGGDDVASYPASYESVISVAAIAENEVAAAFSQTPLSAYGIPTNTTPRTNIEWDVVEFSGGGVNVLSTVPAPNGNVPNYTATIGATTWSGTAITLSTTTPGVLEGSATAASIDGGLCGAVNAAWSNKTVLCQRGTFTFAEKVNNVKNSGGLAAVIYNNVDEGLAGTCADACTIPHIPAVGLSLSQGQQMLAQIGQSLTVVADDGAPCTGCSGGYDYYSGTSMATPGVAAAVGFIWDSCGGPTTVTNKQLRQLLRDSARDLTGVQPADTSPPPDGAGETVGQTITYGTGWDRVTGWGLVQLKDALDLGNTRFAGACPILLEVAPSQRELCTVSTDSTTFGITLDDRFTGSATLSASGLPVGASGSYSPNPIVHPTKLSNYTLSGLTGKSGVFTLQFNAVDNSAPTNTAQGFALLDAYGSAPAATTLATPANGATGVAITPTLTWNALANVDSYTVELSTSPTFVTILSSATVQSTSHTFATPLAPNTTHYWRVRASNPCGGGGNSATFSFTTANLVCTTVASTDVPKAIADATNPGPTPGVTNSTLAFAAAGTINDVDVVGLVGTHSYINDLTFDLISPAATTVRIMNQSCVAEDNFNLSLDDDVAAGAWPCPPVGGGTYRPSNALSAFDGQASNGTWTLRVRDVARQDTGSLTGWGLRICAVPAVANAAPVANADSIAVNEGATATTLVGGNTSVRANDTDAEDTIPTGNVVQVTAPANGALTLNTNGTFSYVHNGSETTSDSFTYNVRDSAGAVSNPATVSITITPQNDAPVAVADAITVAEGGTATTLVGGNTSVRQNDTDAEDGSPTGNVVQVTGPANGALTLNTNGAFSYVHNGSETTSDSFTYNVRDSAGAVSNTVAVNITITAQNDAPVAVADAINVAEGGTATTLVGGNTSVRQNDTDAEDGSPTGNVVQVAGPANGALTLNTNGTFSYVHNGSETTSDSFTYNVRDSAGAVSNTVAVNITITAQNDAPVAVADAINVAEGGTATTLVGGNTSVRQNDTDAEDGTPVGNVTLVANVANGTLTLNNDGTFSYTHNGGQSTTDSFTYRVRDSGSTQSNIATVSIAITGVNDAPAAVGSIANQTGTENVAIATLATAGSFSDADGDTLTYSATGLPPGLSINPASGNITGTPTFAAAGTHNVTVTARDPSNATANQAFTWTIANANQAPGTVGTIVNRTGTENVAIATLATAGSFSDADGDTLTYSASGLPPGLAINTASGDITGTPTFAAAGTHNVSVSARDPSNASAVQLFTWTIANANRAPNITTPIDDQSDSEGEVITLSVAGNFADADSDALGFSATGLPANLSISAAGVITGTLSFASAGTHTVQVTANDNNGGSVNDTFTWTVDATNRAPTVATPIDDQSDSEGEVITLSVAGNFADADSDALSFSATGLPANLSISAAGVITGTLSFASAGTHTVQVTANDNNGGSVNDTFTWTVDATNRAPTVATPIDDQSDSEGEVISLSVAGNFADADSDALSFSATGFPANLSISAAGVITGTLSFASAGTHTVQVTANDNNGGSVNDTFVWTVDATNRAPTVATPIDDQSDSEGEVISLSVAGNFADADSDALGFSATGLPANLSISAAGVITGTLSFASAGTHTVQVTANDNNGGSVNDTFVWTVEGANRAPTPVATIADQGGSENTAVATLATAANFTDADADVLTYSATGLPPGLGIDPFSGAISGTPTFAAAGTHNVTVTAHDTSNASATQAFTWTIDNTNRAPAINNEPYAFSVMDNAPASTAVGAISATDADGDAISATDADGDAISFSITGGDTGNAFAINPATGAITVATAGALTGAVQVILTVRASDGGLNDTTQVAITVQASGSSIFGNGFEGPG